MSEVDRRMAAGEHPADLAREMEAEVRRLRDGIAAHRQVADPRRHSATTYDCDLWALLGDDRD
jgi:hypothetical protein